MDVCDILKNIKMFDFYVPNVGSVFKCIKLAKSFYKLVSEILCLLWEWVAISNSLMAD